MTSHKELTRISKVLSLVLRHQPELMGIELDPNGWVDVNFLIQQMNVHDIAVNRMLLDEVVETNAKKRFAFSPNGKQIRASQGHSIAVELGYVAQIPPDFLFHGTAEKSVASILNTGLEKRDRQQVHLSQDQKTAIQVGGRHGKPVVLKIHAAAMHQAGYLFYLSDNLVWLTDHVPVQFIDRA
ncbi:RNA 2'-phosphotransferase [Pedobacter gandavensis]|uniref:RNA 2'-phosphotransferase n=1 Tax=Pedobacter gandavensis TaxID=2679963 RepID=UPI00292E51C0|nr:RNA 2'-phosphotransferase [Pedobacter gandavensis]